MSFFTIKRSPGSLTILLVFEIYIVFNAISMQRMVKYVNILLQYFLKYHSIAKYEIKKIEQPGHYLFVNDSA